MRNLLFDVGALPYALLTAQPTWRAHGAELARLTEVGLDDTLLDLGCGPGESAFGMVDRVPGLRVTGLDLSTTMVRLAKLRKRFETHGEQTTFVQGDAMRLPFEAASFDAATGHSFLYLVPDAAHALREVARVLRGGRRCAFLEPAADAPFPRRLLKRGRREPRFVASMVLWRLVSRGYGRFDEARFAAAFRAAGLETVSVTRTLDGLGLFGVAKKPG